MLQLNTCLPNLRFLVSLKDAGDFHETVFSNPNSNLYNAKLIGDHHD